MTQPRRWILRSYTEQEQALATSLSQQLGLYPAVGRLLIARGITTVTEAEGFLAPSLEALHDPLLMQDMSVALDRLQQAIDRQERILIYGDYDVDGTTAVALLYRYLSAHCLPEDRLTYYIPDRYEEGYGITRQGIDYAHSIGTGLIISVDTGIKAHEEIRYARELGMDFIICDHHTPDPHLPPATAILNPKRLDNTYPFADLSGCGVAFKFMQGLALRRSLPFDTLLPLLELLVLSIAQDRVPILGENRILTYHGLRQLNATPSIGISYLMKQGKIRPGHVDMASIYYELGPRINAAGRMAHGAESVKLLIARDQQVAEKQSSILDGYNHLRQDLDQEMTKQALELVRLHPELLEQRILVLYDPDWNKGVMGIVAARLADRLHRPVIILARSGDYLSGSARSYGGYDLYQAVQSCRDSLQSFGGHMYAIGMTLLPEHLDAFRSQLEQYALTNPSGEVETTPILQIDTRLEAQEISRSLLRQIESLSPFGMGNERPVFLTEHLRDAGGTRAVGKCDQHLSLRVTDYYQRIRPIHGFALGKASYLPKLIRHEAFALCYELEDNDFYTQTFLQLRVKDLCLESELPERLH